VTLGMGRQPLFKCVNQVSDSLLPSDLACEEANVFGANESVEVKYMAKGSLNFRLGVRNDWWIFPGAELLMHIEAPTNPATLEFGFKLALPGFAKQGLYHNVAAGWGVGVWADNSFFWGVRAGKKTGPSSSVFQYPGHLFGHPDK